MGIKELQPWRTMLVSWGRQRIVHFISCCIWLICHLLLSSHHFTFPSWCCRRCSSRGIYGRLLDNEKNQTSSAIMVLWDLLTTLRKSSSHLPWAPWWKRGGKESHVGLFLPSFSRILKRVSLYFLNYFDKLYIMAADVDLV